MLDTYETIEDEINPIDSVEDVLSSNNWSFDRADESELVVEVSGKTNKYKLVFQWNEEISALFFSCHCDIEIPRCETGEAHAAILSMNENLWLGHFDLPSETHKPVFRHTTIFKNPSRESAAESIEDMVDIALIQCERYLPVLQIISHNQGMQMNDTTLSLALMETMGQS